MNIFIVGACISVVGGASFVGRAYSEKKPPCFVNDDDPPVEYLPLPYTDLQNVVGQIRALKLDVESLLRKMSKTYCIEKENGSFMDFSMNTFTDKEQFLHDFISNQPLFLQTMKEHYGKLNLLASYLQQLRYTANDGFSKKSLASIQNRVYDVMCSIKTVLRSNYQNLVDVVPSGGLSGIYLQYHQNSTRCVQQTLEYIIVLDIKRTAMYLESMYTDVSDLVKWLIVNFYPAELL